MDSIETTLKWEEQFLEMDQPNNSSTDDEIHLNENFNHSIRVNIINLFKRKQKIDNLLF
jgi:hypothetical protein